MQDPIPDQIKQGPHWRLLLRPAKYAPTKRRLPELVTVVESCNVTLRGWTFPFITKGGVRNNTIRGNDFVGDWVDFRDHLEYWRYYASKQFVFLETVREAREKGWQRKLSESARYHGERVNPNYHWADVPGFFSLLNTIYTFSELARFAGNLIECGEYTSSFSCRIEVHNVAGFVLTPEMDRRWERIAECHSDSLANDWHFEATDFDTVEAAVSFAAWFFERCGWDDPNEDVIRSDVRRFLSGGSLTV